jgi:hypothetical protein
VEGHAAHVKLAGGNEIGEFAEGYATLRIVNGIVITCLLLIPQAPLSPSVLSVPENCIAVDCRVICSPSSSTPTNLMNWCPV